MTLNEALTKIGDDIISDARSTLKRQGHLATGKLYNSMKAVVNKSELTFELESYARYVDQGRRAGKFAPVKAIKDWCKVKGIDQSLAYVINRSIYENGIKPSLFFTNAFEAYAENIDEVLDKYCGTLLDELDM
jgi:hypothetical protein